MLHFAMRENYSLVLMMICGERERERERERESVRGVACCARIVTKHRLSALAHLNSNVSYKPGQRCECSCIISSKDVNVHVLFPACASYHQHYIRGPVVQPPGHVIIEKYSVHRLTDLFLGTCVCNKI